jgi:LysM repeat protein
VVFTPPTVVYPAGTTVTTVTRYTAYTVRAGDTLAAVAARFNTTQQAILSANAIGDPNRIFVGQLLTIPRTTTTIVPRPRPVVTTAVGGARRVYIVQPGDNLFSIGARFGRDAWAIARTNGILNLNAIYIGQPLAIP